MATNAGSIVLTNSSGEVTTECSTATISGTLTKNSGTAIESTIESASLSGHAANGECTGSFGNFSVTTNQATNGVPWCLRATSLMKADEFQLRGNGCASASRPIRFILHSTTAGECVYERSTAVVGTYKTHPSTAQLKQELVKISGAFFCPAATFLDLTLNVTTSGNPAWVD